MEIAKGIPDIATAKEMLDRAFKKARAINPRDFAEIKVRKGETARHAMKRALCIAKISSVRDYITTRLRRYVRGFPSFDRYPPFYIELIDSVYGIADIKKALARIDWCADKISAIAKDHIKQINLCGNREDPNKHRTAFYGRVASLMKQIEEPLALLILTRRLIKKLPVIDPHTPCIVVAGAPNVGKSTLVNTLSTARVKVAQYPFTTKDVKVGIIDTEYGRIQIVDTPGLLDRPEDDMNEIERRASAALKYLADEVFFLIDPTETCGYSVDMQIAVLSRVQKIFSSTVVITVLCVKSDLYKNCKISIDPLPCHYVISAIEGEGIDRLMTYITSIAKRAMSK